jgi:DNA repair protein SbcC/Rad50
MERLEEIRANAEGFFNEMKSKKLESITSRGKRIKEINEKLKLDIEECERNISITNGLIETLNGQISDYKAELFDLEKKKAEFNNTTELQVPGYVELEKEITLLHFDLEGFKSKDNTELKVKKKELQDKLEAINKQLGSKDNNEKLKTRMEELEAEEKQLNVKIAELEGQLYLGEEFIRTKVELLEGEINKKFNGAVAFKLFNQQVNGGLNECCEALVNGVPFGDVNTAGQLNAGLSIIKTLTEHYGVSAPIFIDNRESVNTLIDFEGQVINLKVSKDKELKVEVQE